VWARDFLTYPDWTLEMDRSATIRTDCGSGLRFEFAHRIAPFYSHVKTRARC
jgi:hypothetical protein